jgi:centrin-1
MAGRSLIEAVFAELNLCRSNPSKYSDKLTATLKLYNGLIYEKPGSDAIETVEGPENVKQAISQLKAAKGLPQFKLSNALALAAKAHADDVGANGLVGNIGSDGSRPDQRLEKFGEWSGGIGESINYEDSTAEDIVVNLLIDDGTEDKGNRNNILNPGFLYAGVATADHAEHGQVNVIVFAQNITELSAQGEKTPIRKEEAKKLTVTKKEEVKQPAKPAKQPVTAPKSDTYNPRDYLRPGLTLDEIEEVKEAFDLFDTDKSGTVEPKELKLAMETLGFDAKNATLFHMVSDLDDDASGAIDFGEFLDLITRQLTDNESRIEIKKIFNLFDTEKTGRINIKNLRKIVKDLGESLSEDDLLDLIEKGDSDGDGQVTFEDFYNIMTKKFTS